ncbi:MAG: class I SAM-dependent RNA methyltransferase [Nitrospirales bacterium]|nr:class I SAM-dependent RNA methyltransferase [Nitrospirales bacterium]
MVELKTCLPCAVVGRCPRKIPEKPKEARRKRKAMPHHSTVTLTTEKPVYGGLSLGRWQGKVVMVKGALPGERVEVRIEEQKRDFSLASTQRIITPSPDRREPRCGLFGLCGGCQMQYASYERQVIMKEEVLKDALKRLAHREPELSLSLFERHPWHYRSRGQFKAEGVRIGFYREKTREVVDAEACPLMADPVNSGLSSARAILRGKRVPFLSAIREIHFTCGEETLVLIKTRLAARERKDADALAALFQGAGFSGVWVECGDAGLIKYGERFTCFPLGGLCYTVSPLSFFQSHWRLNQEVVAFMKKELQHLKGKIVLDLYAGAGNFSLPLAGGADTVIAVEENPAAIEDGKRNAERNRIVNCRFVHSSAERAVVQERVHLLILDPPRPGLTGRVVEKVLAMLPERIVYISCNPATLARDLRKLSEQYDLESVRMVDFFPQTYHIESLAFLRLK